EEIAARAEKRYLDPNVAIGSKNVVASDVEPAAALINRTLCAAEVLVNARDICHRGIVKGTPFLPVQRAGMRWHITFNPIISEISWRRRRRKVSPARRDGVSAVAFETRIHQ